MNFFKKIHLKYLGGNTDLVKGEHRDVLTSKDYAFITACNRYRLDYESLHFFDKPYKGEFEFKFKDSFFYCDFEELSKTNHFEWFIYLFSSSVSAQTIGDFGIYLRVLDGLHGSYASDMHRALKEGFKCNIQYVSLLQERELWNAGLKYAIQMHSFDDILYINLGMVKHFFYYIFVEIPQDRAREKQRRSEQWQKQEKKQEKQREEPHSYLFTILQISPTNDKKIIKAAYRKLVLVYHPDKGGNPEKFKELTAAYNTLMKL